MRHSLDTHRKEKYQSICFSEVVTLADGYLLTLVIPAEALDVYLVLHRTAWSPIKLSFCFQLELSDQSLMKEKVTVRQTAEIVWE